MLIGTRWDWFGVGLGCFFLHVAMIVVILRSMSVHSFSFFWVSGTKRGYRDASEYHPNHFHVERGGSKMHPVSPPAASCQHPVLNAILSFFIIFPFIFLEISVTMKSTQLRINHLMEQLRYKTCEPFFLPFKVKFNLLFFQ